MQTVRFVGLDVHADSIAIAVAEPGRGEPAVLATIPNDTVTLLKRLRALGRVKCYYEAGPTGFGLHRDLVKAGVECIVVAPSLVPTRAGDRVKTDRRDAVKLARFPRSGDLTELGDIARFATAPQLMGYLGLVPSERSSGATRQQGGITRTGNGHARRILVEAAWAYRFRAARTTPIRTRDRAVSDEVRRIAWRAQVRLCGRYAKLTARGKNKNRTVIAIARELGGFVWAIAREPKLLAT